jgi:hypothetical protein
MRVPGVVVGLVPLVLAILTACDSPGGGHIEISDKTPQQGAAAVASAVCGHAASCGDPFLECGGGTGGTTTCTGGIRPVNGAECSGDAQGDLEELLSCPSLTAAQKDTMELCFDALVARPCLTQADVDALARRAETSPDVAANPFPRPPECAFLSEGFPGCPF